MTTPTPREMFEAPDLTFFQSAKFERQRFERKEAPTMEQARLDKPANPAGAFKHKLQALREDLQRVLCSFAITNPDGGLFVLGIDNDGAVRGLNHLKDNELALLVNAHEWLEHVSVQARQHECLDAQGQPNFIYLFYVPGTRFACSPMGQVWWRNGEHTRELTSDEIWQLKADRQIVEFEVQLFGVYSPDELDKEVSQRFHAAIIEQKRLPIDTSMESVLAGEGVIVHQSGQYYWTRAGYLFLSLNPRRRIPGAYVRALKFEERRATADQRFNPSYDQDFDGPLPRQIDKLRAFFKQGAYFRTFTYRAQGALVDELELPSEAVDEALVNAIVHRSYAILNQPILIKKYADQLVVDSPGRFVQNLGKLEFGVSEVPAGRSEPRNPILMGWFRLLTDDRGEKYVKQFREGTRTIARSMQLAGKPEPIYRTNGQVSLTLENSLTELETRTAAAEIPSQERFTNLFPIALLRQGFPFSPARGDLFDLSRRITTALRDALQNLGWFIDSDYRGELVAHRRQSEFDLPAIAKYMRLYPAYRFDVRDYGGTLFLCIDYAVRERNVRTLAEVLRDLPREELLNRRATYRQNQSWQTGLCFIRSIDDEYSDLELSESRQTITVANTDVLPDLSVEKLVRILRKHDVRFDLHREIKQRALALMVGAARERAEKSLQTAANLANQMFPLSWNGIRALLNPSPARLEAPVFDVRENLEEPEVEFAQRRQTDDIVDGLTRYGAFRPVRDTINLVLVCTSRVSQRMESLVGQLQRGSRKYRGASQTFAAQFEIGPRVVVPRPEDYLGACRSVIGQLDRGKHWLFLVYAPENLYSRAEYQAPYYRVKRFLLEEGFPSQMVDDPTLQDPNWKDLNLALNIVAKCGFEPWVLTKPLAEADCFIGLSFSRIPTKKGVKRFFGYANVFNNLGQWKFYKGSSQASTLDNREADTAGLVRQTLEEFQRTVSVQHLHIHWSEKFSRQMRQVVAQAAQEVQPGITVHFVHVNTGHPVRFYDPNPQGDGSLPRGIYVVTNPHRQFYISTTGYNLKQKAMGTPVTLEVNVHSVANNQLIHSDLACVAQHILSLTKLNWASTRPFSREPITLKYAGNIAYLMNAFLAEGGEQVFRLNPLLEKTPWFL